MIHTEKKWGYEQLLGCTSRVALKKLFMQAGHRCSLQYHEKKEEIFVILSGSMRFTVGETEADLKEFVMSGGSAYTVAPGVIHRMEAITDCMYIEASTPELDDVVRLQDDYGRVGK